MTTREQKWRDAIDVFHEHSMKYHFDRDSPPNKLATRLMSQWMHYYRFTDWWPEAIVYEPGGGWVLKMTRGDEVVHLTVYNDGDAEILEVDPDSREITIYDLPSEPPK